MAWRLDEIEDAARWDGFVRSRPAYSITHSFGWGQLKRAFGWRPRRLLVSGDNGRRAGAQVLCRPIPLLGGELWYAPRGFLADYGDAAALAALTEHIRRLGREAGAVILKTEPMAARDEDLSALAGLGYTPAGRGVQPNRTIYLDLTKAEDELLAGMDRRTRYNVGLAGRKGVAVRAGKKPEELRLFYGLLETTTERQHFLVHNLAYYERMSTLLDGVILRAEHEGDLLAAAYVLTFGRYAYYAHAASANVKRELKATNKLVWEAVRWAKETGHEVFDLWGIPRDASPRNPLYGVYAFKKGFGGDVVDFAPPYDLPLKPFRYRLLNVALAVQSAWRNVRARGSWRDPMGP